jgi:hypothetical protein
VESVCVFCGSNPGRGDRYLGEAEVATWSQLGLHTKPTGLLNVDGFYDHLLSFLDHAVTERFLRPEHRALLLAEPDPPTLLQAMRTWRSAEVAKWFDPPST